tara:strand:+ start:761 stop:1210 length:450 start_codon:yes stop_codon:yes gene_type:complete
MSKKILTEQLILDKLDEKGIVYPRELDTEEAEKVVLKYYDAEIKTDWNNHCQMFFYTQTTADGYEVYMATEDDRSPYIEQDLYYYESDWLEKLPQAIYDGLTIYIDEYNKDEYAYQDAIEEVYEEYWNDMKQEVEDELIEEGYEYEESK